MSAGFCGKPGHAASSCRPHRSGVHAPRQKPLPMGVQGMGISKKTMVTLSKGFIRKRGDLGFRVLPSFFRGEPDGRSSPGSRHPPDDTGEPVSMPLSVTSITERACSVCCRDGKGERGALRRGAAFSDERPVVQWWAMRKANTAATVRMTAFSTPCFARGCAGSIPIVPLVTILVANALYPAWVLSIV